MRRQIPFLDVRTSGAGMALLLAGTLGAVDAAIQAKLARFTWRGVHLQDVGFEGRSVNGRLRIDELTVHDLAEAERLWRALRLERGSTVVVVPSLGPQRIPVPDLQGQGLQSAQVLLAVIAALVERGLDIPVVVGGIVPERDLATLHSAGVAAVLGPGASGQNVVNAVRTAALGTAV